MTRIPVDHVAECFSLGPCRPFIGRLAARDVSASVHRAKVGNGPASGRAALSRAAAEQADFSFGRLVASARQGGVGNY